MTVSSKKSQAGSKRSGGCCLRACNHWRQRSGCSGEN